MSVLRSVILAGVCVSALALASGCDREKWQSGHGARLSVVMFPTAETSVDPRMGFGYYYYEVADLEKIEIDFDFVPDMAEWFDNYYMTLRADYLHILGKTTWYAGGGGGIHYETLTNAIGDKTSDIYFMVEGVLGYVWLLGNPENPFPLDLRLTVQSVLGADNAALVLMGTLSYEF